MPGWQGCSVSQRCAVSQGISGIGVRKGTGRNRITVGRHLFMVDPLMDWQLPAHLSHYNTVKSKSSDALVPANQLPKL
jgi:hypothetical protein